MDDMLYFDLKLIISIIKVVDKGGKLLNYEV